MASFFSTVKKINKVASTISSVKSVTNAVRSGSNRSITSSVLDIADKQRNVNSQINDISGFKSSFSLNGITAPSLGSFASFGSLGGRVNNILSAALELEGIVNSPIRLLSRGADEIYDLTGGRFDTLRKQVENLSQITAFDKFINNKIIKNSRKLLKTRLGNDVLIGSNATILPVKIEKKVVVGAGSVITKDCKKNTIYCGNPAKSKKSI